MKGRVGVSHTSLAPARRVSMTLSPHRHCIALTPLLSPGAVLPPFALPEGIAARHAWAGDGRCSSCGSSATRDRLTAAAAQLQQAAELEQQACAALQGLQPNQLQQQQQQQQHYAALGALQPVLAMRQALLHPHNLLLGQTYHRLATAAAAAAGVLLPDPLEPLQLAGSCGGHGSGSSGGSSCGETLPAALQQACTLSSGAAAAAGVPPAERAALLSGAVDHAQASCSWQHVLRIVPAVLSQLHALPECC